MHSKLPWKHDDASLLLEDANGDIVGHISDVGDGAMITQCANGWDALQSERDRLQERVILLREALEASKSRMEIAAEYLHRFQGACAYHGDQLVGAIKRIDATLEATKEKT